MNKLCIFDNAKICDDCGECNSCDLTEGKICDNCGKCLEGNKSDYRQVNIDEILDGDIYDLDDEIPSVSEDEDNEEGVDMELIDDVEGLRDIISDPESEYIEEVFPGLIKLKSDKRLQ